MNAKGDTQEMALQFRRMMNFRPFKTQALCFYGLPGFLGTL
jgi:hypothetical protein